MNDDKLTMSEKAQRLLHVDSSEDREGIEAVEGFVDGEEGRYPPGLFVITQHARQMYPCESWEDAQKARDRLASLVNNDGYELEEATDADE